MITTIMGVIIVIIILLLLMILVLKMTKKYTHNMILMSRYKGQLHGGKRANKSGQGPPPPCNARKETFFYRRCSPTSLYRISSAHFCTFLHLVPAERLVSRIQRSRFALGTIPLQVSGDPVSHLLSSYLSRFKSGASPIPLLDDPSTKQSTLPSVVLWCRMCT